MEKLVRKDVVTELSERMGVTKKQAGLFLDAFQDMVIENLLAGNKVQLSNFVTFEGVDKDGRTCRNPQTGESMYITPHRIARVRLSKTFRDIFK